MFATLQRACDDWGEYKWIIPNPMNWFPVYLHQCMPILLYINQYWREKGMALQWAKLHFRGTEKSKYWYSYQLLMKISFLDKMNIEKNINKNWRKKSIKNCFENWIKNQYWYMYQFWQKLQMLLVASTSTHSLILISSFWSTQNKFWQMSEHSRNFRKRGK